MKKTVVTAIIIILTGCLTADLNAMPAEPQSILPESPFSDSLRMDEDGGLRESFALWNVRVCYRASSWLTLFARGENLLAQKYEINYGFPMPRATAFGGLSLNF